MCFLFFLNGCVQNAAFLGPAITVAGNGSAYKAGLSYVSNQAVTKITGKTTTENLKTLLNPNNFKKDSVKKNDNLLNVVKKDIDKRSNISDLASQ